MLGRLYRGETNLPFVGRRKLWYLVSVALVLLCIGSMVFKGFNFGIEFAGGTQFLAPKPAGTTLEEARAAVADQGVEIATAQQAGTGGSATYVIKVGELSATEQADVRDALSSELGVPADEITVSEVSSSWGGAVTRWALIGLGVFLALVSVYLWIRFEQKMAVSALAALLHDLILTAGVYSLVGFEVTPGTVVGMLTILGYSLYDTVVVFDRVHENTRGLLGTTRRTYPEAANLAVNETLMRSLNTTIIGILPVAGLLFVGVGLLGVGTLKDLALVLFVGMIAGAYSSIFIATPMLVDLKMMEPRYRAQAKRVLAKRAGEETPASKAARRQAKRAAEAKAAAAKRRAVVADDEDDTDEAADEVEAIEELDEVDDHDEEETDRELAGSAPRPGARPARDARKRTSSGRSSRGGRSGGKRKR